MRSELPGHGERVSVCASALAVFHPITFAAAAARTIGIKKLCLNFIATLSLSWEEQVGWATWQGRPSGVWHKKERLVLGHLDEEKRRGRRKRLQKQEERK